MQYHYYFPCAKRMTVLDFKPHKVTLGRNEGKLELENVNTQGQ